MLSGAARGWAQPGTNDLAESLEQDDNLREGSLRYLVLASKPGVRQAPPLASALARLLEAGPPASGPLELLARLEGQPAHDLKARLSDVRSDERGLWTGVARRVDLRERLDAPEREALRVRLGLKGSAWPEPLPETPKRSEKAEPRPSAVYMATGYPRGFVEGVLTLVGCAPDKRWDLGGVLRRGDDGRPREVTTLRDLTGSSECLSAAGVLMASHLNRSSFDPGAGRQEFLLLPLDPRALPCAAPSDPGPSPTFPVGGLIQEPRRIRSLNPRYPEVARINRIQGVVVLEALISRAGCVGSLRVVRGVNPVLDLEALRTVSRWAYSPTLLGGVAVPVIMTVAVNFKLN